MAQMGDDDTASNHQCHVKSIVKLLVGPAGFNALQDVIIDAIVAAQHHGRHQTEQFLGFPIQGAVMISA